MFIALLIVVLISLIFSAVLIKQREMIDDLKTGLKETRNCLFGYSELYPEPQSHLGIIKRRMMEIEKKVDYNDINIFKETRKFKDDLEKYLGICYITEEKIENGKTKEKFEGYRKIKK